jgi:hypothetical protein
MKQSFQTYWGMFKAAFPVILIIWAVVLVTLLSLRVTTPDIITQDSGIAKLLLGLIFTLVTPLVHFWFKNRK